MGRPLFCGDYGKPFRTSLLRAAVREPSSVALIDVQARINPVESYPAGPDAVSLCENHEAASRNIKTSGYLSGAEPTYIHKTLQSAAHTHDIVAFASETDCKFASVHAFCTHMLTVNPPDGHKQDYGYSGSGLISIFSISQIR